MRKTWEACKVCERRVCHVDGRPYPSHMRGAEHRAALAMAPRRAARRGGAGAPVPDVFEDIDLLGLDKDGNPKRRASARALVDPRASISIIGSKLAQNLGGVRHAAFAVVEGKLRQGTLVALRPERAGCDLVALSVVVDDDLVKRNGKGAEMIFGHDYQGKRRVATYYPDDPRRRVAPSTGGSSAQRASTTDAARSPRR
jgi:hypothetical protein